MALGRQLQAFIVHLKRKKKEKKRHNKEGTSVVLVMQGFFVSEAVPSFIRKKVGTVQNLALLTKHVIFSH